MRKRQETGTGTGRGRGHGETREKGTDLEIEVREEGYTNEDKHEALGRERQGWRWRLAERGGQQDGKRQAMKTEGHG